MGKGKALSEAQCRLAHSMRIAADRTKFPRRVLKITAAQRRALHGRGPAGWGGRLTTAASRARVAIGRRLAKEVAAQRAPAWKAKLGKLLGGSGDLQTFFRGLARGSAHIPLMTDCSGGEAPVWATRALRVPIQHTASCDYAAGSQKFIFRNLTPPVFFPDLFERSHKDPKPSLPCGPGLYVAGFPCKAFSALRHKTQLMDDPEARQFFEVRNTIKSQQPGVAVLENVGGIQKVMTSVMKELRKCGDYFLHVVKISPDMVGFPGTRIRLYFLMIRRDLLLAPTVRTEDAAELDAAIAKVIDEIFEEMKHEPEMTFKELLHPESHPEIREFKREQRRKWEQKSPSGSLINASAEKVSAKDLKIKPKRTKHSWVKRHHEHMVKKGLPAAQVAGFFGRTSLASRAQAAGLLTSQRQTHCLDMALFEAHREDKQVEVVNLSQSGDRSTAVTSGKFPCVTPGGLFWLVSRNRPAVASEKLLLNGFPMDKIDLGANTAKEVESIAGNTMHIRAVAAAITLALAMVQPEQLREECRTLATDFARWESNRR